MTSPPTTLISDYGGVLTTDLWDSVRACARRDGLSDNAIVDLVTLDPVGRALFRQLERGDISQPDGERRAAAMLGNNPDRLLARMCADLRPDHRMIGALTTLRRAGIRTAILSNSWGAGYFDPYAVCDLDDCAELLIRSDAVGVSKPDPAIYALMLDRLGVDAADCLFVDDVAANLVPAAALGMRVLRHTGTDTTLAELARHFPGMLTA